MLRAMRPDTTTLSRAAGCLQGARDRVVENLDRLVRPVGLVLELVDLLQLRDSNSSPSRNQLLELGTVARRSALRKYIVPALIGRVINDLRELADALSRLSNVDRSADPGDNFLLAMAGASDADYLVTGDKRRVLVL
jgi:putative PIN family toxin of toxin-antitoxin system